MTPEREPADAELARARQRRRKGRTRLAAVTAGAGLASAAAAAAIAVALPAAAQHSTAAAGTASSAASTPASSTSIVLLVRVVVLIRVGYGYPVGDLRVGPGHLGRVMMSGAGASGQDGWFTTTVRPAGPLDHAALARLSETLGALEPSSDMVVVDLTAADVRDPRGLARHLLAPARRFDQAGRCMLVVGASPGLKAELGRAAVPVVTLASEVLHGTAA